MPSRSPSRRPDAQLDRDRQAAALRRGARQRDRAVAVGEQRRAGAGAADLRHRAAHVDVDQVGARGGDGRRRRAHHLGVGAEQLDRDRAAVVLARVDPQQLAAGLRVAVVDAEARHHLRDHEAGAEAARLQPHEPVADPGQRREHDAVGQLNGADASSSVSAVIPPG